MLLISTLVIIFLINWYFRRHKRMTILKRNGIPGPEPHFIVGNMIEYYKHGYNDCFKRWHKKYGRIFGYYLGAKPFLVVTDPELLKLIQIKDFHNNFFDRPYVIPGGSYRNWKFHQQVNRVDIFKWKKMRTTMSPWFSSSQLKSMVPIMQTCIEEMMTKLEEKSINNEEFNICHLIERLTMDTIHRCAFGIESGVQSDKHFPLLEASRQVLSVKTSEFLSSLLLCFPEFSLAINFVRDIVEKVYEFFQLENHSLQWNAVKNLVENRIETNLNSNKHKDMIQLMIEKRNLGHHDKQDDSKTLTMVEIIANLIGINEAAYESPANNIAFILHCLLNNPNVYETVVKEIDKVFMEYGTLNYETANHLIFTEAVIHETFRMFPTDPLFISHSSSSDYKYGLLTIPKGVDIRVPMLQLHYDSEFWTQPNSFNPYRFYDHQKQSSINPLAFQPFGIGPRLCPGKRFSILEVKLILANILYKYKLCACNKTELGDIQIEFKLFSITPKNGIYVRVKPRTRTSLTK